MDCPFISDESKYISGSLMALSAMLQLGLPHLNVLPCSFALIADFDQMRPCFAGHIG